MTDVTFGRHETVNLVRLNTPRALAWADRQIHREGWLFIGEGMIATSQDATPQVLLAVCRADLTIDAVRLRNPVPTDHEVRMHLRDIGA